MILSQNIKNLILDKREKRIIHHRRVAEIDKINDPRRVKIAEMVQLSKEQKEAIDEVYMKNYGSKIPYIWHQYYTAYTGNFDPYYAPELLYIPEFERFMNIYPEYVKVFEDKNILPYAAKAAGIKMPTTILTYVCGLFRNKELRVISKEEAMSCIKDVGEVFIKPTVESGSGKGCFIASFHNGIDEISGKSISDVLDIEEDYAVQERLRCHESISKLYNNSVNTFRIITYRWKDRFGCFPSLMRIGKGGSTLDNAHAGGIFIGITADGKLKKDAFTEFHDVYSVHPDSGVVFEKHSIPLFPKVLEAAFQMHETLPELGCVNWDFTLDENGTPILIEANISDGSIWLSQMSNGVGAFGQDTPEILEWIHKMEGVKLSDRYKYRFGR